MRRSRALWNAERSERLQLTRKAGIIIVHLNYKIYQVSEEMESTKQGKTFIILLLIIMYFLFIIVSIMYLSLLETLLL